MKNKGKKSRRVWHGISHGFYAVERSDIFEDSILSQREQVENSEIWLFGVFDHNMGAIVKKYLRSNIFEKIHNEGQIEKQANKVMKKAYLITAQKNSKEQENKHGGFAAMFVINGDKFIVANFGEYRAVSCSDGLATETEKMQLKERRRWYKISELLHLCIRSDGKKAGRSSKLVVKDQKVTDEIEFVILASDGVWEVMSYQEAVDLIRDIEDAQQAAQRLAGEALSRMSKATISCIVIRFH